MLPGFLAATLRDVGIWFSGHVAARLFGITKRRFTASRRRTKCHSRTHDIY